MTTLHDFGSVLGRPLGHFLLGFHNFMVTALGSCVKWPLHYINWVLDILGAVGGELIEVSELVFLVPKLLLRRLRS
jgi:hypothetical protein